MVSEMCKRNYEKEKSTICNATKKDLACLKGSLILQEEKSAQSKEILPVVQAEKEFMKKYEIIAQTLCATYNIPLNRFLSLIGRETDFIDHFQTKKFNRRSFGFCQLTKAVFDDMKANTKITPGGRGDKFVPFFNKILENKAVCETVSSGVSGKECAKTLDTLREVCVNGKITNKEKYNQAIESLYNLAQKDQHVNLFISTLFQNFHASNIARNNNDPVCEISPKNITQWRRTL